MELRHLRYFIAVGEELNFRKASRRLHISEPPLSRQIQQLEGEIGIQLFHREAGRVALTAAGGVFLEEAKRVFAQIDNALDTARLAQKGKSGLVRVGITQGLGHRASYIVAEHSKSFPQVEVEWKSIVSGPQNEALVNCIIDVGILRPHIDSVHLLSKPLFKQQLAMVMRRDNPLAKHRTLQPKQIAGEPLLLIDRRTSSLTCDKILKLLRERGVAASRQIFHLAWDVPFEELAIMISSGKGSCIVPSPEIPAAFSRDLIAIPIAGPDTKVDVNVAWRRGERSQCVLNFVACVRKLLSNGLLSLP